MGVQPSFPRTWTDSRMSLIPFHRVLIVTAIVFCAGFAGYEWVEFSRRGELGPAVLGGVFLILAVALALYLRRLNRFLGYDEDSQPPR